MKWYLLAEVESQDVQLVVVKEQALHKEEHATHCPLDLTNPDVTQST